MGQGLAKDGRPTVSDLIQAREAEVASRDAEAALRKELAEKHKRHEAFRWEESCRTSRIIAAKELEYLQQVQQLRGLLALTTILTLHQDYLKKLSNPL